MVFSQELIFLLTPFKASIYLLVIIPAIHYSPKAGKLC